jgi:hypothetical protein
MNTVHIKDDFGHRLANRDEHQGDGTFTAVQFRERFLNFLDNKDAWKTGGTVICLDFSGVKKIGPSFANEAFAYFTKYAKPDEILSKIKLTNATEVQLMIIKQELEDGYRRH